MMTKFYEGVLMYSISIKPWCGLALIGLATQPVNWVELILSQLIKMLMYLISRKTNKYYWVSGVINWRDIWN